MHWSVTLRLGHDHHPEARGFMLALHRYVLQIDRDGLLAVNTGGIEHETPDPDTAGSNLHVLSDNDLAEYLMRARNGDDPAELLHEIELAGLAEHGRDT